MINYGLIIGLSTLNTLIFYCIKSRYNINNAVGIFTIILGLSVNISVIYYIVSNLVPVAALISSVILVLTYRIILAITDSKLGVKHYD